MVGLSEVLLHSLRTPHYFLPSSLHHTTTTTTTTITSTTTSTTDSPPQSSPPTQPNTLDSSATIGIQLMLR